MKSNTEDGPLKTVCVKMSSKKYAALIATAKAEKTTVSEMVRRRVCDHASDPVSTAAPPHPVTAARAPLDTNGNPIFAGALIEFQYPAQTTTQRGIVRHVCTSSMEGVFQAGDIVVRLPDHTRVLLCSTAQVTIVPFRQLKHVERLEYLAEVSRYGHVLTHPTVPVYEVMRVLFSTDDAPGTLLELLTSVAEDLDELERLKSSVTGSGFSEAAATIGAFVGGLEGMTQQRTELLEKENLARAWAHLLYVAKKISDEAAFVKMRAGIDPPQWAFELGQAADEVEANGGVALKQEE